MMVDGTVHGYHQNEPCSPKMGYQWYILTIQGESTSVQLSLGEIYAKNEHEISKL